MTGIRLNIACGPNVFPNWINIDKVDMSEYIEFLRRGPTVGMPPEQKRLAERVRASPTEFVQRDIRKGIPYGDGTVDLIVAGQFIEHLNPMYEAPSFVRECRRVLKPGGIVRISTPDFGLILDRFREGDLLEFAHEQPEAYRTAKSEWTRLGYILFGSLGPCSTSENYEGHQMAYSEASILELLQYAGFADITFWRPGRSQSPVIEVECVDTGVSHSLFAEATK